MKRSLWVWLVLGLGVVTSAGAADFTPDFLGPESCKSCHAEAYASWKQTKHARAMEGLSPVQQKDVRCLTCHAPNLQDASVSNISCETCHGGGQYYSASYVMKDRELVRKIGLLDPTEKSCRACHDASSPSLRPFEFAEKLKLIDHWSADRAKRGATKADTKPEPRSK